MTEEREKSLKEKKIENYMGIGESLQNLDKEETIQVDKNDAEKKRRLEERKAFIEESKKEFLKIRDKSDLDFSREVYKELIQIDMEILRITRKELEIDPSPRHIETAASLTSAITATIDSLRDIDEVKFDQGMEKEKLEIKKNQATGAPGQNVVMIGSMSDVLKLAKTEMGKIKTIDVEVIEEKKVEGTKQESS